MVTLKRAESISLSDESLQVKSSCCVEMSEREHEFRGQFGVY